MLNTKVDSAIVHLIQVRNAFHEFTRLHVQSWSTHHPISETMQLFYIVNFTFTSFEFRCNDLSKFVVSIIYLKTWCMKCYVALSWDMKQRWNISIPLCTMKIVDLYWNGQRYEDHVLNSLVSSNFIQKKSPRSEGIPLIIPCPYPSTKALFADSSFSISGKGE